MKTLKALIAKLRPEEYNSWGLSLKLTAAYSVLIVVVAGALTASLYVHLWRGQRQAIRDRLLDLVSLATPQIDGDYHSLLITEEDKQRPYYQILSHRLHTIQAATQNIERIYTLRQQPDGSLTFVLDYIPQSTKQASIGQKLEQLTPLLKKGIDSIQQPIVEQDLLPNQVGKTVLYGYAPIVDPLGRREGLLAIQLDASAVINSEIRARNQALLTLVLTLPLALGLGWWLARRLTSPIAELVVGAEAIAQGQLNLTVPVRSRDEVGMLAAAFNRMTYQLKESFDTLEAKVADRTSQLAQANQEITVLNQRLKAENLRMGAELEVTRQLQKMILPTEEELSQIPELDIAGFMEPAAEVGGDYYDIVRQDDRVKISIGDVTGHGLESGVLMIMVQTAVRTLLANNETDPVKFLNTLNQTIYENVQRMNSDKNLTLSLLDYSAGVLSLSGQHEEIIVVRANGEAERIDTFDLGFPIGLEADITQFVASAQIQLSCGDGVVLYTDGITEAEDIYKNYYGLERLISVVTENWHRPAKDIRQSVVNDLRKHIGTQKVFDDITLVVLKQK